MHVGVSSTDYRALIARHTHSVSAFNATAHTLSVVAGRLSYTFGLQGPSVAYDTACSSALTAAHGALQGLRLAGTRQGGGAGGALLGGINVMLVPDTPAMFQRAGGWGGGREGGGEGG